jgi:dolichol-phosphate mannosyltransferase
MSERPDLTVVLPTLDESDGLRVLLPRLKALFEKLGVRGELLVVDGGSKDDTAAVAEEHGARVQLQKGRGFGSAVREGIEAAGAERVALMDADGSHAPEALEVFWARRHDAELIVGSRYCRGGSAQMDMTRQLLSRSLNLVSRRVLELPVRESSSGFRLYFRSAALAVASNATDFSIQQDLMVGILAAGGRVVEVPIHYAPRVGGASKANAWKLAPAYVRLLLRLKPRRGGWRGETGLALVLAGSACAGFNELGGASAAFFLAAGALCVHETVRLRGDRLAGVLAAAAWPAAALAGAPLASPRVALAALLVFLAAAAADSVFP